MKKQSPTNSLTQAVIDYLRVNKFKVWRNNNGAVYDPTRKVFRKNSSAEPGVSDVLGVQKGTGRFIAVEIKAGKDRIRPDQLLFLEDIKNAGGIAIVCHNFDGFLVSIHLHI